MATSRRCTVPDPTTLAAIYQSVINRYEAKALDFDIEGDKVLDQASIQRRNLALVALREANPGLTISYTLPVLPSGLDGNGVGVLTSAKRDGFNPDVVNVLAMNYGASVDNGGQMGRDALTAASNTALQVKAAGLTSPIGVIPMIGVNDVSPEVFTLADASLLAAFAASNAYIARLSMWSVSPPNGSCAGSAAAASTCSGIAQSPYAFSAIFEGRSSRSRWPGFARPSLATDRTGNWSSITEPRARPPATRHEHPLPTYEASRSSQLLIDVVQ